MGAGDPRQDPRAHEQIAKEIVPVKTSDFPSPAVRPANSALDCEHFYATFGIQLPDWKKTLGLAKQGGRFPNFLETPLYYYDELLGKYRTTS